MRRGKSPDDLRREWQPVPRHWFAIYRWDSLSNPTYAEPIAALILEDYDRIGLNDQGLREKSFRLVAHRGQCQRKTSIEQFTEKRFLRALFNRREVNPFGKILDYEIPLKANQKARHGDIDLLSLTDSGLHLIEAKVNAQDSLLKALLQAFTYTCLVQRVKARFLSDYQLAPDTRLISTVLTLRTVSCGKQLLALEKYPNVGNLLRHLHEVLIRLGETPMEFYLEENSPDDLRYCLAVEPGVPGEEKIIFTSGFQPRFRRVELLALEKAGIQLPRPRDIT